MPNDAKQNAEVMGMVERVACAILAKVPLGYGMTIAEADEYARAAIEAMREPTDAMGEAGQGVSNMAYLDPDELPADAHFVWQAMIDAALNEQVTG